MAVYLKINSLEKINKIPLCQINQFWLHHPYNKADISNIKYSLIENNLLFLLNPIIKIILIQKTFA